ncbi:hypothetical protein [Arenimonas sp.]|uniref:hypothetical protein n=1 Tax=Arenimonas sp. TaxID=1872635 RepID=UPI0025C23989|nr:hypothetical protein [Arenimonas sp.]
MSENGGVRICDEQRQLCEVLQERYGAILTLAELGEVLRFPSHQAACKARRQGRLPFHTFQVPHRRGWFATASDVAAYLSSLGNADRQEKTTMET